MKEQHYSDIPHYPVVRINTPKREPIKHNDKAERILNQTIIGGVVLALIAVSALVIYSDTKTMAPVVEMATSENVKTLLSIETAYLDQNGH